MSHVFPVICATYRVTLRNQMSEQGSRAAFEQGSVQESKMAAAQLMHFNISCPGFITQSCAHARIYTVSCGPLEVPPACGPALDRQAPLNRI